MVQPHIQTAFHAGEWSPSLYARVDLQKYHSAAALLRNFYVDYRGGASTRPGTKYINQCFKSATSVRLIPFQPSSYTSYVLEFGNFYIRFHSNGSPILEAAFNVTSITGNSVTAAGNNFVAGDWVFIGGQYYIVLVAGSPFTVSDIWGNSSVTPSGTTAARVYTLPSPFAASDLFPNPLTSNPGIKFVADVNNLIICHPSYAPQILTINSPASWTIAAISFGSTIGTPTNLVLTSTDTGGTTWYSAYLVTAVDPNGQESAPPTPATFAGTNLMTSTAESFTLSWTAVAGAQSYNVYKASQSYKSPVPVGAPYGFIGNVTGTSFIDSEPGLAPDFATTPPVVQNPFSGSSVQSYTVTNAGAYTAVPTVSVTGGGGVGATAQASLGVTVATINNHGPGNQDMQTNVNVNPTGSLLTFSATGHPVLKITSATLIASGPGAFVWTINSVSIFSAGSITSGNTPSNPISPSGSTAQGFQFFFAGPTPAFNFTWGVTQVFVINGGEGYTSAPSVAFSAGAAAATAVLTAASGSNPSVPGFLQERLVLAGLQNSPQSFDMSQPDSFFNFNTSNPTQPDDAISGSIFSGELNDIKSLTPVPTGLLILSGRLAWIVSGGGGLSAYNPITPSNAAAAPQTFTGANDLPPLKIAHDILYCTNKGSYVRDLSYNFYMNVFTGSDISVMSSHLFFNHFLYQWCWAEEPFKTMWAVRDDGLLLSLAYVKDQELMGWSHHDTNGQFMSVCTVLEYVNGNAVDAVYVVVKRTINGQTIQNVERFTDRYFNYGMEDSWAVDCALQTVAQVTSTNPLTITGNASTVGNSVTLTEATGAPFTAAMATNSWVVRAGGGIYKITAFTSSSQVTASVTRVPTLIDPYTNVPYSTDGRGYGIWQPVTTVSGLTQLIGQSVTGVADGVVVPATTVSSTGTVTLSSAASKITLGLSFTPQLQTLPLDLGQPTIQGRPKQINAVTVRVADTLGLSIGSSFSTLVAMKESQLGNQNYYLNAQVTDLIDADTRTQIDSTWTIPGQYCIQQSLPYPASILGVIPEIATTQRQQ